MIKVFAVKLCSLHLHTAKILLAMTTVFCCVEVLRVLRSVDERFWGGENHILLGLGVKRLMIMLIPIRKIYNVMSLV